MLIKLCFDNETHLISKQPKSFKELLFLINQSYKERLPSHFDIHYKDSDGDNVILACDQDLEAMYEIEGRSGNALKIIISPNRKECSLSLENSNIMIEKPINHEIDEFIEKIAIEEVKKSFMEKMSINDQKKSITVQNYEPEIIAKNPENSMKNAEKTLEKNLEKTVEKTIEKNLEKTLEKIVEKNLEKNLEKAFEKNLEKPMEKNLEKNLEKPIEKIADENVEKTLIKTDENADKNCRRCKGTGFNTMKGHPCRHCNGKGTFEAIEKICKKCSGSGFNVHKNRTCKRCEGKGIKSLRLFKEKIFKHKGIGEKHMQKISNLIDEKVNLSISQLREELNNQRKILKNTRKSSEKDDKNPEKINEEKCKKIHQENKGLIVHERYTCDGCSLHPIVGIRYKCSVCKDFDYCEDCEAKIEHEHAFLKIKHPNQAPRMIFTAIEQIPQTIVNFFKKKPEEFNDKNTENKTEEHLFKELELSFSEGIYEEFPKIFEKKSEKCEENLRKCEEKVVFGFELKENSKILPELILESTNFVFISFSLRNSGKIAWPETLRLENMNKTLKVDDLLLPALAPGEEISLTMVVENPKIVKKHELLLEIHSLDEKNKVLKEFMFEFEVIGKKKSEENIEKVEKVEKVEKNTEKMEKFKGNKEDLQKAQCLKEMFGGDINDFMEICEKFRGEAIDSIAEQVLNDRLLMDSFSKFHIKN